VTNGIALVTGAGAGLGRASALALARAGYRVVVNDRDRAGCAQTVHAVRSAGGAAEAAVFDVTDAAGWQRTVDAVDEPVTVLVNNAALKASTEPGDGGLLDLDLDAWDRMLAVNLTGPMLGTRAVLPGMLSAGRGSIVMVSSISAVRSVPGLATAYTAAKAGLIGLTRAVAATYGAAGIRCNALAPGIILAADAAHGAVEDPQSTSLSGHGLIAHDGRAEEIGAVVRFLASDDSAFVNGQTLVVDGGISVHLAGVPGRVRAHA
jgi:NAD(P)-dependent dehydrogenase (short-subunit alcohol dehydrogenase family)